MIYGLVPIGGKGTRLSLPYSKEMLPQKNYDYFNPVVNHLVQKMLLSGAEKIVFVHGLDYKQDVKQYFTDEKYVHVLQTNLGFANVIHEFFMQMQPNVDDKILFGLPDSVFDKNLFVEMLNHDGITCGLFTTNKFSKVDRLNINKTFFEVKSLKTDKNLDWFWGILKFDGKDLLRMEEDKVYDRYTEIGHILNMYKLNHVFGDSYLDLGTWSNYNRYLTSDDSYSNVEIEKKYDAKDIDVSKFIDLFKLDEDVTYHIITSTDYYYTLNNSNVEFLRYRESSDDEGAIPDITIKNFNQSQLNRFELTLELDKKIDSHNVFQFLSLIGTNFEFSVTKTCHIFKYEDYTVVMYTFKVNDTVFKIIEIELNKIDFNLIASIEDRLSTLSGFNPHNTIQKSKFQIIKEINDSTH